MAAMLVLLVFVNSLLSGFLLGKYRQVLATTRQLGEDVARVAGVVDKVILAED